MAIIILCIVVIVVGYEIFVKSDKHECVVNVSNAEEVKKEDETIEVYVVGCVKKPGVYEVKKGVTIAKVANEAGGFTDEADLERINLVHKLKDNVMVEIKSKASRMQNEARDSQSNESRTKVINAVKDEVKREVKNTVKNEVKREVKNEINRQKSSMKITKGIYEGDNGDGDSKEELQVNINIASKDELSKLPGVGGLVAEKIIKYREENGEFESIDDLKNISGIGESKFNNIKDMLIV